MRRRKGKRECYVDLISNRKNLQVRRASIKSQLDGLRRIANLDVGDVNIVAAQWLHVDTSI